MRPRGAENISLRVRSARLRALLRPQFQPRAIPVPRARGEIAPRGPIEVTTSSASTGHVVRFRRPAPHFEELGVLYEGYVNDY